MAIKDVKYVTYSEAVFIHIRLMRLLGEERFGVFDKSLIESALARPKQSATYENSSAIRQASTLFLGLIKNHPWIGGNKRTASAIVDEFLYRNGFEVVAEINEIVSVVLKIESDEWKVDEIEDWFTKNTQKIKDN